MQRASHILKWIGLFLVALAAMVVVHEVGHTVTARALGDPTAAFHIYERYPNGGYCIGCNTMDLSRLSHGDLAAVSAAGVIATLAVAGLAIAVALTGRLWAVPVAWAFALDLPVQLWQLWRADLTPTLSGVDLHDLLVASGAPTPAGRVIVTAVCLIVGAMLFSLLLRLRSDRRVRSP